MQRAFLIGILSLAGAAAVGACGSSTTSTASTATGGSASTSSKASTGTGTAGSATTGSTGGSATTGTGGAAGTGGSSTGTSVNNCTAAAATDMTGMATVSIAFGGATGLKYAPPCIKVTSGTKVTFTGDFTTHPLQAGVIANGTATPATAGSSPLPTTAMATGTTATFTITPAGTYGYYCTVHGVADGMEGAIIAE
jgi:plastocyanin